MDLTLDLSRKIIQETLAEGRKLNLKPLSVVVLDSGGHVKAFEREDGASPGRFTIAYGKAYGAVMLGMTGTAQMARAEQQHYFMTAANGAFGGHVIPVPGGIFAKNADGGVVGAIGVTGDTSENDLLAGTAGILATGLVAEG